MQSGVSHDYFLREKTFTNFFIQIKVSKYTVCCVIQNGNQELVGKW